jgi:hypothetical protein
VQLHTPNAQGVSQRESFEKSARQVEKTNPAWAARIRDQLTPVEVPAQVRWLLRLFDQLNSKRKAQIVASFAGAVELPEPISSLELEAHCRLYGVQLTPWDAETIDAMDSAYREESAKLRR